MTISYDGQFKDSLPVLNIADKRSSINSSRSNKIVLYNEFFSPLNETQCYSRRTNGNEMELKYAWRWWGQKDAAARTRARACVTQPHRDYNVRPCKKGPAGMQILSKDNHFSGIHTALPLFRVRWILHGNRSSRAPVFSARKRPRHTSNINP